MKKRLLPDRWEQIINLVERQGSATVEQIASALGVSPATVRRDLTQIEERGLIKRTRGGAEPSPQVRFDRTLAESRGEYPELKEFIGAAAAELVEPGDTLMIDGGFTTYQVARHLVGKDLTVVTNSFDVTQALVDSESVSLVLIGGELNITSGTTVGPLTESQIAQLRADKAILGANGLTAEAGLTSPNPFTAQTKRAMIAASREVIIVADHTKLGRIALYAVAPIGAICTLVTDDKANPELIDAIRSAGVEVVIVSPGAHSDCRPQTADCSPGKAV